MYYFKMMKIVCYLVTFYYFRNVEITFINEQKITDIIFKLYYNGFRAGKEKC
ncbi:hypothetical protein J2W57_000536 [Chryseobacterium ginsenosidimutans]|uniref:Uncharacterized protein n=1 Tax=Chryseobacterium geocarposphaerae TaxID=1416776 RepID=A0ABU1LA96_9FLAO|nr:hypothetical protein [Chryseobacterium geocarposphaerae]MDR6697187.1 hypothetical protein [Chryseobacterium ginsenosidimutans]